MFRTRFRTFLGAAASLLAATSLGVIAATVSATVTPAPAHASTVGGIISRSEVLARAQWWMNTYGIIYSQRQADAKSDGDGHTYRPDCSGFVSMAWHLPKLAGGWDRNTDSLATQGDTTWLNSYDELLPGDALLGVVYGHVALFAGWDDSAHTRMRVYEEYDETKEGNLNVYNRSFYSANGFRGLRYNKIGDPVSGGGRLAFVKTRNTGSGKVEVHQLPAPYQSFDMNAATGLSAAENGLGSFEMLGNQLVYFKTRSTGSGKVELHTRTAESGFQSGGDVATWFNVGDGGNGVFQMVNGDIVFIKTRNTSTGKVEVHRVSGANLAGPPVLSTGSIISTADAGNGTFQMSGNDLVFIKTRNTSTGKVEVHVADGATNYGTWKMNAVTAFSTGDGPNGFWSVRNVWTSGVGDLIFIKTRSTSTGKVELFGASAGAGYQQLNMATPTAISSGDGGNGSFNLNLG